MFYIFCTLISISSIITAEITNIELSYNQNTIITSNTDGYIYSYEINNDIIKKEYFYKPFNTSIIDLETDLNQNYIFSIAKESSSTHIWDINNEIEFDIISLLKNITSVVIQKELVLTIIEDNHNLSNWDVNIGEKLIGPKYFNKSIESVEPLRKNKCIILGYKNSLEIIDGLSYKSKKKINPFNFGKITIIKTSKDGSYFAVGSSKGKIRLYDSKTYKRLGKYQFDASIIDIAFVNGSNSAIILTKSNNSLFYLNFSEEEIIPFDNEGFDLLKVFSVDNNQIISIDKIGELIYWDLFTLKKIRAIRLKS